ncbi:NADP-dependent oxidoreductase [Nocardia miyunensis]|uniref:NADP-dependent oxidoreductase n=1 Tax=Nocardia miyunensis TaxID=282684 RepID=UPI00082FE573|nr:NADP-dependent oxidoreductase [Nocardia miyunensis]
MSRRIVLASRPAGAPRPSDFRVEEVPVPRPQEGELLLRTIYLSLDPYVRGRLGYAHTYRSASPLLPLDEVLPGGTVCEVVDSGSPEFTEGDIVLADLGWQSAGVRSAATVRRLDPDVSPVSTALGVLGMPGFTAYVGLNLVGRPNPGETVVVAAATGPVGSMVGQLALLSGCRAVGIAGGPDKVAWLRDNGFAAALDHRSPAFADELAAAVPDGVDIYFENVGGRVLDAVLPHLNAGARVPVCGLVSEYNGTRPAAGPDRLPGMMSLILSRAITVQGFTFGPYTASHQQQFLDETAPAVREGRLRYREDIVDGLEAAPTAFIGLLGGANFGKQLVQVGPDPTR